MRYRLKKIKKLNCLYFQHSIVSYQYKKHFRFIDKVNKVLTIFIKISCKQMA